jgi:hypothetical protein
VNRSDGDVPDTVVVPDDVVDLLGPGDQAPDGAGPAALRCAVGWRDVQDLLGDDPPWRCGRPAGHGGQHIAFARGSTHVAAVLPADG